MPEFPLTVSSIVDEVANTVRGYTRGGEEVTSLAVPMEATDLHLTVDNGSVLSRGVVEVEDELVQLKAVTDSDAGTADLETWGRGVNGSTASAHPAGAKVTVVPAYPRVSIKSAVQATVREIFPYVYPVGEVYFNGNPALVSYDLPADAYETLSVETRIIGPGHEWMPLRRWRTDKTTTSQTLMLYSPVTPGTNSIRVLYMKYPPSTLDGDVDLSTTGYGPEVRDLLVLGATAKLMAFTEPGRVQTNSVESSSRGLLVPAGSAVALSRMLYQQFQKRLEDVRRQLLMHYPPQQHRTR